MNKIKTKKFNNNFEWSGVVDYWLSDGITFSKDTKVIFSHDSQSFYGSRKTWNNKSWRIEELANKKKLDCIVISAETDGSDERVNLLSPFSNGELNVLAGYDRTVGSTGGAGAIYLRFMVDVVIPTILKEHNIPLENDKYIIGSSMGGYINTYALAMYPDVFKGFGIFSPAYWYNLDLINRKAINYIKNFEKKIYMDIGTNEGRKEIKGFYYQNAVDAAKVIKKNNPNADMKFIIDEGGIHDENAWADRLEKMIDWFLA